MNRGLTNRELCKLPQGIGGDKEKIPHGRRGEDGGQSLVER